MKNSKLSDSHTDMTLTRTQILAFFFLHPRRRAVLEVPDLGFSRERIRVCSSLRKISSIGKHEKEYSLSPHSYAPRC